MFPLISGPDRALITDLVAPIAPEKVRPQRVILSEGGLQFPARRVRMGWLPRGGLAWCLGMFLHSCLSRSCCSRYDSVGILPVRLM
ncbi:MAG: hypothetical protein ABIJ44_07525 [Pseudomonadota bacterium]